MLWFCVTSCETDFAKMEEWIGRVIQKLRPTLICALGEKNHAHTRRYQQPKIKDATNKKTRDEEENRAPVVHMMHNQSTTFIRDRTFLKLTNPPTTFLGPIGNLLGQMFQSSLPLIENLNTQGRRKKMRMLCPLWVE